VGVLIFSKGFHILHKITQEWHPLSDSTSAGTPRLLTMEQQTPLAIWLETHKHYSISIVYYQLFSEETE